MASNDSYPDPPISSGDQYSSQNAGFKPYSATGESSFLHRISPESSSLPYAKRPKQNPEMENHRYRRPLQLDKKCRQHCANVLIQSYSIRLRRARYEVHFLFRIFFSSIETSVSKARTMSDLTCARQCGFGIDHSRPKKRLSRS